jgi:hypothetical protein
MFRIGIDTGGTFTDFIVLDGKRVRCYACGHCCPIPEGSPGVCKVRFNRDGRLMVPFGYVAGAQADPVEKKPFFHVRPGSLAFSFGMLGCDLHCSYCQNWVTSQALRDPEAVSSAYETTPEQLVRSAAAQGAQIVVSTYNEPLITSEWAVAVFQKAKAAGLGLDTAAFNACIDSGKYAQRIQQDMREGAVAGASGVPSAFINGRFLNGARPYEEVAAIIKEELQKKAAGSAKR